MEARVLENARETQHLHELKNGPATMGAPIETKSSRIMSHALSGGGGTGANLSSKAWSELLMEEAAALYKAS